MGCYTDHLVPRMTHWLMRSRRITKVRRRALAGARGVVLEIGFGSGLNLAHYPETVERVLAVEPSPVARQLARNGIARTPMEVTFAGGDAERLELASASVDCVVSTWTLCTVPAPALALAEIARVLKPDGMFLFAEHGLSPDPGVARWQNRLNGLEQRLAGGCHLNRAIDRLIAASPLAIATLNAGYLPGPRTHTYMYVGVARKPAAGRNAPPIRS